MDWQIDKCKYTSQMTGTDIYIMVCITRKWLTFIWSQSAIGLPITLRIFGIEAMCLVLRRLEILSAVDVEDKSWQCVKAAAISPHSPSSNPLPELLDRNGLKTMCSNLSPVDPRFITTPMPVVVAVAKSSPCRKDGSPLLPPLLRALQHGTCSQKKK